MVRTVVTDATYAAEDPGASIRDCASRRPSGPVCAAVATARRCHPRPSQTGMPGVRRAYSTMPRSHVTNEAPSAWACASRMWSAGSPGGSPGSRVLRMSTARVSGTRWIPGASLARSSHRSASPDKTRRPFATSIATSQNEKSLTNTRPSEHPRSISRRAADPRDPSLPSSVQSHTCVSRSRSESRSGEVLALQLDGAPAYLGGDSRTLRAVATGEDFGGRRGMSLPTAGRSQRVRC